MDNNQSFLAYRRPGDAAFTVLRGGVLHDAVLDFGSASVSTWLSEAADQMQVCCQSTAKEDYCRVVADTIAKLQLRGGKTVICRQICGRFKDFDLESLASEYFSRFADMFCFLFHHPDTSYWMGASPELLVVLDTPFAGHTRALAGTRRGSKDCQAEAWRLSKMERIFNSQFSIFNSSIDWDAKNLEEHAIVVEDICRRIESAGCSATPGACETLPYSKIEHLCTPIDFKSDQIIDIQRIISAIHPTAAIAGYPKAEALADIEAAETTPRKFYGGHIATPDMAYVVLRCVHFDAENWCVYTGSGITPASNPESEWLETEAKAQPLIDILSKYSL